MTKQQAKLMLDTYLYQRVNIYNDGRPLLPPLEYNILTLNSGETFTLEQLITLAYKGEIDVKNKKKGKL